MIDFTIITKKPIPATSMMSSAIDPLQRKSKSMPFDLKKSRLQIEFNDDANQERAETELRIGITVIRLVVDDIIEDK